MSFRVTCTAVLLTLAGAGSARAGEDYFLLMFGSQRVPNNPEYSHSFASFVRVTWEGDGPCPVNPVVEEHTISWLPCDGQVRVYALKPRPGRNWELHETIRWCVCNHMRVSLWGAYRICPELYYNALNHINLLESGQVRYKALDMGYSSDRVTNCIHAVANVVEGPRVRVATPGWGEPASYVLLQEFEPFVVQRGCTHPWVALALGLDQYPIIYRDFEDPRSGGIRGPVRRLFGAERDLHATYGPPVR